MHPARPLVVPRAVAGGVRGGQRPHLPRQPGAGQRADRVAAAVDQGLPAAAGAATPLRPHARRILGQQGEHRDAGNEPYQRLKFHNHFNTLITAGAGHARAVRGPDAEDAPRPPLLAIPTSTVTQVSIWNKAQSNKLNHLDLKRLSKNTIDCAMPLF